VTMNAHSYGWSLYEP